MDDTYWLDRWIQGETGFHQSEINPYLKQYWQELQLSRNSEIFVPLCGKSGDMLWLSNQGYSVLGVELSAVAIKAFFDENGYFPQHIIGKKLDRFEANDISILFGNFFDLDKNELMKVKAVYDRASMVALPPKMRKSYVNHLVSILPPETQILLITFDYPQTEMIGPPFSVSPIDVETLYHEHADIRLLAQVDVLAQNPRFQARGFSRLHESVFLLKLKV